MRTHRLASKWFVMLSDNAGRPLPMLEAGDTPVTGNYFDDKVALFDSEEAAEEAASHNPLALQNGHEVYAWAL